MYSPRAAQKGCQALEKAISLAPPRRFCMLSRVPPKLYVVSAAPQAGPHHAPQAGQSPEPDPGKAWRPRVESLLAGADLVFLDQGLDPALLWPCRDGIPVHQSPREPARLVETLATSFPDTSMDSSNHSAPVGPETTKASDPNSPDPSSPEPNRPDPNRPIPNSPVPNKPDPNKAAPNPSALWIRRGNHHLATAAEDPFLAHLRRLKLPYELLFDAQLAPQNEALASPLRHKRIVLTRAAADNRALARTLLAQGAIPVNIPTLKVNYGPDDPAWRAQRKRFFEFFGLILSSPRGVFALHKALLWDRKTEGENPQTPPGAEPKLPLPAALAALQIVAVGPATARALQGLGYPVHMQARHASSEGLVLSLRERGWLARSWMHLRGDVGRTVIRDSIQEAGGRYELAVAYRCEAATLSATQKLALCRSDHTLPPFDAVYFASAQSAERFFSILDRPDAPQAARSWMQRAHRDQRKCPPPSPAPAPASSPAPAPSPTPAPAPPTRPRIITLGPITAQQLEERGFVVDVIAQDVEETQVLAALTRAFTSSHPAPKD